MPKSSSKSRYLAATTYYHRPEWDDAVFGTQFGGDMLQKLAWSGLNDRSCAELSNLLSYVMWALSNRFGGRFTFSLSAFDWRFGNDRFDPCIGYDVQVLRNGTLMIDCEAYADIFNSSTLTWSFDFPKAQMGEHISDADEPLDLLSTSGLRAASCGFIQAVEMQLPPLILCPDGKQQSS